MTHTASPTGSASRRIALLAGQAFSLGLLMSWILIPATAIFLATYGSGLLPVTYLGAAAAGAASSAALSAAFRRRPLATVVLRVLTITSVALVATWAVLLSGATWVSFGLLVLVPIVVPVGFMLLVGQAGMLLDVRVLKAHYARVIAGFALGFVAGGLAAPRLLDALGRTEHLVLAAAGAGALWAVLLMRTRRQYPAELSTVEHDDLDHQAATPSWGDLLRHRYVALIVAFQMLSAVESQWLDFLVYDRAAQRYDNSQELARFISRFSAIAYGADILFLLVIAGALLRRFGLRYGLSANPGTILTLVIGVIMLSSLQGAGSTLVFVLIVAARVTDLVLGDGAARASLSAAYQVVPTPMRLAAQAGVEGMAVPLAIGVSGLVLLGLRATVGTAGVALPILVSVVVTAWLVVAVLVYRSYRVNLLTSLRYRVLDGSILSIDDPNSLAVVARLLDSEDARDVRLGLDTLALVEHPDLADRLCGLTGHENASVRTDAIDRLSRVDRELAAAAARRGLSDPDPGTRAMSVRVLSSVGEQSDLAALDAHRSDEDAEVTVACLAAMARLGDERVRGSVAADIARLGADPSPQARTLAARVLGACELEAGIDRAPLRALLTDADHEVASTALLATHWPEDRSLLGEVASALRVSGTAGAAADALVRAGDLSLPVVDEGLAESGPDSRAQVRLARVAREVGGPGAIATLTRHMKHRDREVGLAVLTALGALASTTDRDWLEHETIDASSAILGDLEQATHVLRAIVACTPHPAAHQLRAALRDELDLLRRRVLAGLAAHYGEEPVALVSFQFANGDARSHALAIEWLEVTLTGTDHAAVALIEPGLSEPARLRRLAGELPLPDLSLRDVLHDLVTDAEQRWRQPWVQACAYHVAWSLPEVGLDLSRTDLLPTDVGLDRDATSIVAETMAAIRARAGNDTLVRTRVPTSSSGSDEVS